MVKVLKTQDENYIRSVRQTGRKKIDKLKAQLTALADLMTPGKVGTDDVEEEYDEDDFDEEDVQVLQDAGVLPSSSSSRSGKRRESERKSKHVLFVSNPDEARNYKPPKERLAESSKKKLEEQNANKDEDFDLGWDWTDNKKRAKQARHEDAEDGDKLLDMQEVTKDALKYRKELLKELAARLKRDLNLRYAMRELEMQRLMMGKGAARKIRGFEKVDGEDEGDDDDEDALDARKGKKRKVDVGLEERPYRPRVYKWRAERKK